MMKRLTLITTYGILILLIACGGGSQNPMAPGIQPLKDQATSIDYVDPTSGDWRLLKDASSTPSRLVLNLVGPTGIKARGVAFTLRADHYLVSFGKFSGSYIRDLGVFHYYDTSTSEPKLIAGGVQDDFLMVGAFQKRWTPPVEMGSPLFQVAVEIPANTSASVGDTVALTAIKAKVMPEDIATVEKSRLVDVSLAVGTLSVR